MNDIASPQTFDVAIPIDQGNLPGFLDRPVDATGLVLFAHGSGSSRFSSRNQAVAEVLSRSRLATLLMVGGLDVQVLELNRDAAARMTMAPELQIVPGATHLFEEPGTLGAAASLATDWFRQHLG